MPGIFLWWRWEFLIRNLRSEPCVRPERAESSVRPSPEHHPNIIYSDLIIPPGQGEHKVRPYERRPRGTAAASVGRIVQAFKSLTTRQYLQAIKEFGWPPFTGKLWQRNYYERIIRDEDEWARISDYIAANPINWALDRENREGVTTITDEQWQV